MLRTMNVIFGATGKVSGAAAAALRGRGLPVRAVVRDAARATRLAQEGCAVATADLADGRGVEEAMHGAEGVLVICPVSPGSRDVLGDAERTIEILGRAIEAARPRRVVAISDYGAHHPSGTGITVLFHRLEARLGSTPAATTFLRSAEHMQNWARYAGPARAEGILPSLSHPVTRLFPVVSAFDVGVVAAEILAAGDEPSRLTRVLHVEGPRRYAATDVARVLEGIVGRPVIAEPLESGSWMPALMSAGLSESYARLVAELAEAHNAGLIDIEPGGDVRRGPTELAEALPAFLAARVNKRAATTPAPA